MTTLDYLEKIDDTLANWEDYFHGQEGTDVTEARANLGKVREQLLIHSVIVPKGTFYCDCVQPSMQKPISETEYECFDCGKEVKQ